MILVPQNESKRCPRPIVVTTICFLTAMAEGFDNQAMGVAAPKLIPDLAMGAREAGWAFSSGLFGLMVGAVIGGYFADLRGRRPVLIISTLIFTAATFATAAATEFGSLVLFRSLAGLGMGGALPVIVAMTAEAGARNRKVVAVALAASGLPAGGLLAGLVGRMSVDTASWQFVFVLGGGLSLVVALLQLWLIPKTKPLRAKGQPLPTIQWSTRGAVLMCLMCISFGLVPLILHLLLNWLPTLLKARGFAIEVATEALVWVNLGGLIGAMMLSLLVERVGIRIILPSACLALAFVLTALGLVSGGYEAMILSGLAGFFVIGTQFSLWGVGSQYFSQQYRGRGMGLAVSASRLGSALGPLVAGQLLAASYLPEHVMKVAGGVSIVAAAAIFLLAQLPVEHDDRFS